MIRTFIDYFKCPLNVVHFTSDEQPKAHPGFFSFGEGKICYGSADVPVTSDLNGLADALPAAVVDRSSVRLPFDLDEVANNLRLEKFVQREIKTSTAKRLA